MSRREDSNARTPVNTRMRPQGRRGKGTIIDTGPVDTHKGRLFMKNIMREEMEETIMRHSIKIIA